MTFPIRNFLLLSCLCLVPAFGFADIERGREIYSQVCFNCHGPKLEGGQGPALNDQFWQHGSSPEAILEVINKGVTGTPMIPYESVFPEADRKALRDFIVSEQEGLRETVRSIYPRDYFKGKRFTPELFDSVESESQTPLPENHYYIARDTDGVLRGKSKLYIKEPGNYQFKIRIKGKTSILINGKEVHYSDEKARKEPQINETFNLKPGVHEFEILHEERDPNNLRFWGALQKVGSNKQFVLVGRSLQGNIPKFVRAIPGSAQVVRKWIDGLPPRTLLCLLPNSVIVAYNPVNGEVVKSWHTAEVNQTPSLPDRSAKPSEINGEIISEQPTGGWDGSLVRFIRYEIDGENVIIVSQVDGEEKKTRIEPKGPKAYTLTVQ